MKTESAKCKNTKGEELIVGSDTHKSLIDLSCSRTYNTCIYIFLSLITF